MEVGFKLDAKRLAQAFDNAEGKLRGELILTMKKAARNVALRAKREHRFVTRGGRLEASIDDGLQSSDPIVGYVTAGGANAPYAAVIHGGSGLHGPNRARYPIVPRFRKVLRWAGGGKFVFAKKVMHPGVNPDPFLDKALEAEVPAIETMFNQAIDNSLK